MLAREGDHNPALAEGPPPTASRASLALYMGDMCSSPDSIDLYDDHTLSLPFVDDCEDNSMMAIEKPFSNNNIDSENVISNQDTALHAFIAGNILYYWQPQLAALVGRRPNCPQNTNACLSILL